MLNWALIIIFSLFDFWLTSDTCIQTVSPTIITIILNAKTQAKDRIVPHGWLPSRAVPGLETDSAWTKKAGNDRRDYV